MKRLLVICDMFPPAFGPRMGYLCKYLQNSEWQPFVLTEELPDCGFGQLAGYCPTRAMQYYSPKKNFFNSCLRAVLLMLDLFFACKTRRIYREGCRLLNGGDFSLILCSAYRDFPLAAAVKLSERYGLPLVADFRDIVEQYAGFEYIASDLPAWMKRTVGGIFKKKLLASRNRLVRRAACITTVSQWHVEVLSNYNPNVRLIYNGYDDERFRPAAIETDRFNITYAGRLQSRLMRDPELLFTALKKLEAEGELSSGDCRVQWYTDNKSWTIVQEEAARFGVEHFMEFKGYIPAGEVPEALNASSVLLLLTNESPSSGNRGIMTTKVFEYLAVEKPVLCVRSDGSLLEELVNSSGAGLATSDGQAVKEFLLKYYRQWKRERRTSIEPDRRFVESFSRRGQAAQFISLFNDVAARAQEAFSSSPSRRHSRQSNCQP